MFGQFSLPQHTKIVDASAGPVTTNGGVTFDYVSLKNVVKAWIIIQLTQAVGHATVINPKQATAVAGTSAKDFTAARGLPILWLNEDTAATDTLVKQTDAATLTVTNNVKKKLAIIEIDPAKLDVTNGFDVLGCTISDSSQATNFVSAVYVLMERYAQATPPAAITD